MSLSPKISGSTHYLQNSSQLGITRECPLVTRIFLHDPLAQKSVQSLSRVQLCDPMNCSMSGFPVHHQLPGLAQTHIHWLVMPSNHLILCRPLLLLLSIFSSIRIFSSESVLPIKWAKYWSFSFSISPSNEYSGLISFRIDWFDLLAVHGTLKSLLQHHSSKASILQHSVFLWSNSHIHT